MFMVRDSKQLLTHSGFKLMMFIDISFPIFIYSVELREQLLDTMHMTK